MISKNELKYIKSLKLKKYRAREKKFLVEGIKNVSELVKSDFELDNIFCTREYTHLISQPHQIVSKDQLKSVSSLKTNESCLAVAKIKSFQNETVNFSDHVIVLDHVGDPGNLGTIIRSLDWFGFSQIICSTDSADFYNPKTISASMGSFTRVHPIYTDLHTLLKDSQESIYGLMLKGTPLQDAGISKPSIFILGSESHGISHSISKLVQNEITIPGKGAAESLNVAVSTTVLLYHLRFGKR
ncbi:MAG: RNA methyltransferase [Bacteroidetes bacterium]|nr:RNA methyltransferase [Bacteroidota bacterium]